MIAAMSIAGSDLDPPHVAARRLRQIIESRFADGLERARTPSADGPGATAESLRTAYLGLLKLALCDLVGTTTTSVERAVGGEVMSRELADDELRFRAAGLDWPLHGLSMVGLARLDDLQRCVESVVADGVVGDLIECGSWRGGAAMLMRATLDTLGETERTVFVADSFQGFPEVVAGPEYSLDADLANVGFLSVPLAEVRASFARLGLSTGVTFVAGFFAQTLPALRGHRWAVARLDGDSYDATRSALDAVYPSLSVGGYLVIDDFYPLDDCRRGGRGLSSRARDRRADRARRLERGALAACERGRSGAGRAGRSRRAETALPEPVGPASRERNRVPTTDEVAIRHELSLARERLAAAEREIGRLTGAPLAGPRAWLRSRRRGIGASR